jgi:hypothetical protein
MYNDGSMSRVNGSRSLTTIREEPRKMAVCNSIRRCTKCGEAKSVSEFNLERGKPRAYCKACHRKAVLSWQKANPEKRSSTNKRYLKKFRLTNPPRKSGRKAVLSKEEAAIRDRAAKRAWEAANPERVMEKTRRYQAAKRCASPGWADRSAIVWFYKRARELTAITGIPHEVDHIIPLVSDLVCGLHCEFNLQVLPLWQNRSKANKVIETYDELPADFYMRGYAD